ncbi:NADH-quinone oxidoreductase subunit J [Candidatus Liberibacter americanus]|uniref:NADH-quinone oxidoreductase subunit J n=1 Tax=Candidatus Liberibacter americanus str. Sao Paulo TaxID=1261131 RepID=U6B4C4_9HYPH|nr:NADH-quinone oxidoreductase subunit J [Candidatus Liberibacter americanus]AHA27919.1 NADH-ubiquinone oxidoreductase chain J [Candidatus Liberibacter americanus str. Sao Paulo]EMS36082.1 NADH dehydrogenase subunit J [Candidatus Liberibacter americanus PW_SP]
MVLQSLFFYLFSFMAIMSSLMVVISRNPVNSVFFLIFIFLNAAGILILLGAEFVAMITLVAYVGAVVVLFLFVIMMIDINIEGVKSISTKRGFLGAFFIGILSAELIIGVSDLEVFGSKGDISILSIRGSNTEYLGTVLYTNYAYPLEIAAFILLLSMIGAIVLTLRHRTNIKRQNISKQLESNYGNSVEIVKVKSGQGI